MGVQYGPNIILSYRPILGLTYFGAGLVFFLSEGVSAQK